jgi:lysophospholipase L1-like esterase
LGDLAVSVYLPGETGLATTHALALHTTYISKEGDFAGEAEIADASTMLSWFFLSAVDVMAPEEAFAIVTFGDSITDGATSTPDMDRSWPGILAGRLPPTVGIANQGISGNRVLRDGAGVSALARFDRDVLGVSGVKWLTIMESINDIGIAGRPNSDDADRVTAHDLIAALNQMVERAHTHGIKVAGATLTPYEGAGYYSETGEVMRQAVNNWIRTGGAVDAVIDFDKVTQDPEHSGRFLASFNNTDHLHPNDVGYKAMADAVDLSLFTKQKGKKKRK